MRIALLSWETLHSVAVGGVACHVSELAKALAAKGHDVHVFTRIAPGQTDYAWIDGVHYYRCAYTGDREFVDDVNNMCRAFVHRLFGVEDTSRPFELIHAHDWLTANAMIWIKKGRARRGVFTVHATEYGRSGNVFDSGRSQRVRAQERAGTIWADRVIAVSHTLKAELAWMYELPDWQTSVVYNGVDRQRFDVTVDAAAVRSRYGVGPTEPMILFCGRLEHQKGPDLLVEGFVRARGRWPNAKLVFAGDGSMRDQLERRAHECGAGDAVRFPGMLNGPELPELFKAADAVAVPSRNEPFGIVVLEAWSAGKPVLATHNGGPGEYVEHEVDGLKIYDHPDSIAWGISRLFEDFAVAREMGRCGRQKVERGFTWAAVADETLKAYHEAAPELKRLPLPPELTAAARSMRDAAAASAHHNRAPRSARRPRRVARTSPLPTKVDANRQHVEHREGVSTLTLATRQSAQPHGVEV